MFKYFQCSGVTLFRAGGISLNVTVFSPLNFAVFLCLVLCLLIALLDKIV